MKIDFEYEISELTPDIESADSYLACEKAIISNIRKHIQNGRRDTTIDSFLEKLSNYFNDKIQSTRQMTAVSVNYKYAKGFLNTLHTVPYWKSWIVAVK